MGTKLITPSIFDERSTLGFLKNINTIYAYFMVLKIIRFSWEFFSPYASTIGRNSKKVLTAQTKELLSRNKLTSRGLIRLGHYWASRQLLVNFR